MKKILLLLVCLFSLSASALSHPPLEVDQAFQLTMLAKDDQTLVAQWKIAPGYYLYRERIYFNPANPEATDLGRAWMPNGVNKSDPELGHYEVYENELKIVIPITKSKEALVTLTVDYQGCSEEGYCYPPTQKVLRINRESDYWHAVSPINLDLPRAQPMHLSQQDKISQLLANDHPAWILLAFLGFGVLISLTPCVLPMIPILSSIIMGQKNLNRRHSFLLSLSYVLGMALTYAAIGIFFGLVGGNLQTLLQKPVVIITFSLLFVAMAFSLFGFYELQLPPSISLRIHALSGRQRRGSYMGALVMGVLSTLILSPCVTAPLVGVLAFISERGSMLLGGSALFMMGFGMGVPLLILGINGHWFVKAGPWMSRIKTVLGLILLGVAIYMLSRLLPAAFILLLWALLALIMGIVLGALKTASHWRAKMTKVLGLLLCVYAIALTVSLIAGNTDPLHPWVNPKPSTNSLNFIPVKNIEEVKKQVAAANGKPVLLDFYADWCVSCKLMERNTFTHSQVRDELRQWVVLRADLTANDEQDKTLSHFYHIIAPPSIVFFDSQGHVLWSKTWVGEISANELVEQLKEIK